MSTYDFMGLEFETSWQEGEIIEIEQLVHHYTQGWNNFNTTVRDTMVRFADGSTREFRLHQDDLKVKVGHTLRIFFLDKGKKQRIVGFHNKTTGAWSHNHISDYAAESHIAPLLKTELVKDGWKSKLGLAVLGFILIIGSGIFVGCGILILVMLVISYFNGRAPKVNKKRVEKFRKFYKETVIPEFIKG